jgi:tetratricopeptide (TPR) repeat protein
MPDAPPRALAALGNVLVRRGAYVDALEAYRSAADLDPNDAPVHWMCGEIAHVLGDDETSTAYRARALALQRIFRDPLPVAGRTAVLLLLRDLPYSTNTPLELIVDRERFAVHKWYVEDGGAAELPDYDVAFTGFGSARSAQRAVDRAAALRPNVNDPNRLASTARERLASTLHAVSGVSAPQTSVRNADGLRALTLPVLVRPVDTHAGEGFVYAVDRADLEQVVQRHSVDDYYVSQFTNYRSADGYYRKFRVIFVEGRAYPYHLAIAPQWMVHYQSAPMEESAAARAEEAAFLTDPRTLFPSWDAVMPAVAEAIGLEYFGIDATVLPGGGLFVFEADAAMLVHDEDPAGIFSYKRPYVARIRAALEAALTSRKSG